ncbi:hypothetical protein [Propionicimonas sp.]|uniref:hypothetical protein n=1 Tax=Propionicimonas sp. TaxID=1955623 RepID=UPI0039E3C422
MPTLPVQTFVDTENRRCLGARYSVHYAATNTAREYRPAMTLAQVRDYLASFAYATGAELGGGAWADVYPFHPNDNENETWGGYPLRRYVTGPRGGVRAEYV